MKVKKDGKPRSMKVNDLLKSQRKPSKRRDTIVFDESARKNYVTGFAKRKDERREIAKVENERKARELKIETRKERREAMAFALSGGIVNRTKDEDEDEGGEDKRAKPAYKPEAKPLSLKRQVYENTLTTTTVTAIDDNSDAAFALHAAESSEDVAKRLMAKRQRTEANTKIAKDKVAKRGRERGSRGKGSGKGKGTPSKGSKKGSSKKGSGKPKAGTKSGTPKGQRGSAGRK
ncbi:hypothetical protein T492DRAFT_1040949 [Pavlovales sp. CCMP2436]|nr:hypothetical protein T492DRAFT_1040949 [Pavlovales sp. CCMP2436]